MKKFLIAIAGLAAITAAFLLGQAAGINHALTDSEMFIMELGDYEGIPEGNDYRIWIHLDGESYEHFGFIG